MKNRPTPSRRRGFSLIEILVAMTILTVIVLVVSAIFQQTSLAWTIGLRRAEAQSSIRAVVGALSRDLTMVVDPTQFTIGPAQADTSLQDSALTSGMVEGATGNLSGNSLDFWILRPANTSSVKLDDSNVAGRELVHVTYSLGGGGATRTEETYDQDGESIGSNSKTTNFDLGDGGVTVEDLGVTSSGFSSFYDVPGMQIKIRPARPLDVNDYEIAVGSKGPDRQWGTDDDIRPWVKGEDN